VDSLNLQLWQKIHSPPLEFSSSIAAVSNFLVVKVFCLARTHTHGEQSEFKSRFGRFIFVIFIQKGSDVNFFYVYRGWR
jgi:hypothetical protein